MSEKLGIEIALYGVGDWKLLPRQTGTASSFETEEGELAPWMVKSIEERREMPWWFHTHPDMPTFLSRGSGEHTDLRGVHALWDMIRRPFKAVIAGHKNQRTEVTITKKWIRRNPPPPPWTPPPPPAVMTYGPFLSTPGNYLPYEVTRAPYSSQPYYVQPYAVPPGLGSEVSYLIQKYGAKSVYEELDQQVFIAYSDRR